MKRIYKYPLAVTEMQSVDMPHSATILTVKWTPDGLMLWAEVNPQLGKEPHYFYIYGTGHRQGASRQQWYIGTVIDPMGLVWHVYSARRDVR